MIRSGLRSPEIDTGPSGSVDAVESLPGEITVPTLAVLLDLLYASGAGAMARADNGSTATVPAVAIVVAKPTSTTATVAYFGRVAGFAGLTPGAEYFVGTSGALVLASGLPSAPGSVAQKIGTALDADALLFDPGEIVIL